MVVLGDDRASPAVDPLRQIADRVISISVGRIPTASNAYAGPFGRTLRNEHLCAKTVIQPMAEFFDHTGKSRG